MDRKESSIKMLLANIANAESLEAVCEAALSATRVYAGADGATLVLREGDFCHYYDERAIGPLWRGARFEMDICVSGTVMRTGAAVCIPDISQDARIPFDLYEPTFVRSLCLLPVGRPDAIAALGAYWQNVHVVNADQLLLLTRLASAVETACSRVMPPKPSTQQRLFSVAK